MRITQFGSRRLAPQSGGQPVRGPAQGATWGKKAARRLQLYASGHAHEMVALVLRDPLRSAVHAVPVDAALSQDTDRDAPGRQLQLPLDAVNTETPPSSSLRPFEPPHLHSPPFVDASSVSMVPTPFRHRRSCAKRQLLHDAVNTEMPPFRTRPAPPPRLDLPSAPPSPLSQNAQMRIFVPQHYRTSTLADCAGPHLLSIRICECMPLFQQARAFTSIVIPPPHPHGLQLACTSACPDCPVRHQPSHNQTYALPGLPQSFVFSSSSVVSSSNCSSSIEPAHEPRGIHSYGI